MKQSHKLLFRGLALLCLLGGQAKGQVNFQNLDFENGAFVRIPGDPYGRVEWGSAMPGWTGYLGTNQIEWIFYNGRFLSEADISIWGPDQPAGFFHNHYYLQLVPAFPVYTVTPAIAQTGTIPAGAASVRFETKDGVFPRIGVSFAGQQLGVWVLGGDISLSYTWGADVSQFAGRTGALRFFGEGYLDNITFSDQAIPEPGGLGLLSAGFLLLGWWHWRQRP